MANIIFLILFLFTFSHPSSSSPSPFPFLFVGTYTESTAEVPYAKGEGIYVYRITKDQNGSISLLHASTLSKIYSPSFLDVTSDKRFLYASSESSNLNESVILGYQIWINDRDEFEWKYLGSWETGGPVIAHMRVDDGDNFIFASMYTCGCIAAFKIDPESGKLEKRNFLGFNESSHVTERQDQAHLHSSLIDDQFRFVYFADLGNDCVYKMDYSNETGFNKNTLQKYHAPPGTGPRHMIFHPNQKFMYVTCELNNSLIVYQVWDNGDLELIQLEPTAYGNVSYTSGAAGIDISPHGEFLYVSTRFVNVITVYKIGDDGKVKLVQQMDSQGDRPRNILLYPSTRMNLLFVANQESNDVVAFSTDKKSGNLTKVGDWLVKTPECLKVVVMMNGALNGANVIKMSLLIVAGLQIFVMWMV